MADITYTSRFEDGQIEQALLNLANQVDKLQSDFDGLGAMGTSAFNDIEKAVQGSDAKIKEYTNQVEKAAKETREAEKEAGRFSRGLKALFGNISFGGVSINDLADSLGNLKGGLKDVASSGRTTGAEMANVGKGFGVLRLGAIGVAVAVGATLVAAFTRFSKNADALRAKLAGAKAGFLEVANVAGVYGNKILEVIKGNKGLRDALQEAKTETKGWANEVRKAADQAERLEQRQIKLERQTQLFNATYKFQRGELEKLSIQAEKFNDLSANSKRQRISQNLDKENIRLAEERLGILLNQNNATEKGLKNVREVVAAVKSGRFTGNDEGLQKFIESLRGIREGTGAALTTQVLAAVEEYGDLTETIQEQQSEIQSQRQSIIAANVQARKDREAALETAIKRANELRAITVDAEAQIGGAGRVAAQNFANATAEVIALKEEYKVLAKQLKTGESEADIDAMFQPLLDMAAIDFEKASFGQSLETVTAGLERLVKIATDPVTGNIADLVAGQTAKPLLDRLRENGLEAGKALQKAIRQGQEIEQQAANQQAKDFIKGLAPEFVNSLFEAEQARFELRIAQQDALIGKIQERLDIEKQALEEQQKLADDGFAADVAGAKKRVEEQERLLREGEARKLDIERKAAKQRAIIAAGETGAQYTLAVVKLIAAEASKGLIGIAIAAGGLTIISRLIAAGRSQAANEANKTAAFATGTEYVHGPGTGTSDSIHARLSKGERVVTAKDNARLGGSGMSNKELIEYALIGQRVYDDPLLGYAQGLRTRTEQIEQAKIEMQLQAYRDAALDAARYMANEQIEYWKTRPVQYRDTDGSMIREWAKGNQIFRQIEPQGGDISEPEA